MSAANYGSRTAPHVRGSESGNRFAPTGREVLTRSGVMIDVTDPRPDQMRLGDIAHSLAHQERFAGQCPLAPTVAQHSVAVEYIAGLLFQQRAPVSPLDKLDDVWEAERGDCRREALMHDAAEYLVSDLTGAVKQFLRNGDRASRFDVLESGVAYAIERRFELTSDWGDIVHEADCLACAYEMAWGGWCVEAKPPRWVRLAMPVIIAYHQHCPGGGSLAFLQRAAFLGIK